MEIAAITWWLSVDNNHFPIVHIAQRLLDDLERRVPDFPEVAFRAAVSHYVAIRDAKRLNEIPPPKAICEQLDKLASSAISLSSDLQCAHQDTSAHLEYWSNELGLEGIVARLQNDLLSLMGIAEIGRRDAKKLATQGGPVSARTHLVARLAGVLDAIKLDVTSRPQDRLVLLYGIALEAAGETNGSEPERSVRSALETIKRKGMRQ